MTRIVSEAQLRERLDLSIELIDAVAESLVGLSAGRAVQPPVMSMALEAANAEVDVKTAYVQGLPGFAVKVSTGFFNNPSRGLPSLGGLMILFDAETGAVRTVFADNGYLTDLRTAAAGAVAARALSPEQVDTAAVLGTGVQARLQMRALHLVRPFANLMVWGRDADKAARLAGELADELGVQARVASSAAEAVQAAQVAVTTTPSREPLVDVDALHPGLHITAMGSDADYKNELAPAVLARADAYVVDHRNQCRRLGEWRSAIATGLMDEAADPAELGEVLAGQRAGRNGVAAITVADLTGTGVQDTAIALFADRVI